MTFARDCTRRSIQDPNPPVANPRIQANQQTTHCPKGDEHPTPSLAPSQNWKPNQKKRERKTRQTIEHTEPSKHHQQQPNPHSSAQPAIHPNTPYSISLTRVSRSSSQRLSRGLSSRHNLINLHLVLQSLNLDIFVFHARLLL